MIGFATSALHSPKRVLVAAGVWVAVALGLCTTLQLDNDPRKLAPTDAVRDAANARHEGLFGADDALLLVILSGDETASLAAVTERLQEAVIDLEHVQRVQSPCNIRVPMDDDGALTFTPAFGSESKLQSDTAGRIAALERWTGGSGLVSLDGRHMVLAIRLDDALKDPLRALQFVEVLEARTAELVPAGVQMRLGGMVATRVESIRAIFRDLLFLFPLAGLIVFLVALWRFRSLRYTVALVACIGSSITLTAGFTSAVGWSLNPLTQVFPILLMIIGVADGVHLIERQAEAARSAPGLREAWSIALAETGRACVLTTVTTAVGFLALFVTRLPVLHEFAVIVSVGVCFSLLANLLLLPALCLRFCAAAPSIPERRGAALTRLATFSHRHGKVLTLSGVALLAWSGFQYSRVDVDYFLSRVLAEDNPVSQGNATLREHFGGSIPVEWTVVATAGDFNDPEPLAALHTLNRALVEEGWVVADYSLALEKTHLALTGSEALPTSRSLAAQLELVLESSKPWPLLGDDRRVARLSAVGPDIGAKRLLELKETVASVSASTPAIEATMVGAMIGAAEGFSSLVTELITGLFVALGLVILLIGLALKSLRAALVSVLPNCLPIALGLAFFAVTGRYLDIFSAVFFTVALGIAVDDTIHLLSRYQLERTRCDDDAQAVKRAADLVGRSLADTSWILISGFALLMLSGFPANRVSGALAAGLIGAALVFDLVMVPAGIKAFGLGRAKS